MDVLKAKPASFLLLSFAHFQTSVTHNDQNSRIHAEYVIESVIVKHLLVNEQLFVHLFDCIHNLIEHVIRVDYLIV